MKPLNKHDKNDITQRKLFNRIEHGKTNTLKDDCKDMLTMLQVKMAQMANQLKAKNMPYRNDNLHENYPPFTSFYNDHERITHHNDAPQIVSQ